MASAPSSALPLGLLAATVLGGGSLAGVVVDLSLPA